jgi:DNA-binding response OmpR family regulator
MYRICVIEDSTDLHGIIKHELGTWYHISSAHSLRAATEILKTESVDLILLDVNLPDGNGFEYCGLLKSDRKTKDIPVIFLTAKSEPIDKMMGFSIGADDYIVKPFEPIEVRARIQARLKKATALKQVLDESYTVGPLRFDRVKQRAYATFGSGEMDLQLTPLEFKLLSFLAMHEGKIFNRVDLMKAVSETNVHVKEENIYTHICAVRRKLGSLSSSVECIPRVGYRMIASLGQTA